MKIIRWFFSHAFLIVLIVAVIYSYMYWGNLIGEDTPAGKALAYLSEEFETVDEFMVAVREKQAGHESASVDSAAFDSAQQDQAAQQEQQVESVQDDTLRLARDETRQETVETGEEVTGEEVTGEEATGEEVAGEEVAGEDAEGIAGDTVLAADEPVSISYSHNQQRVEQDSEGGYLAPAVVASQAASAGRTQLAEPAQDEALSDQTAAQDTEAGVQSVADTEAGSATADHFVSEEIAEQLDNVDDSGRVIDPVKNNEMVRQEWIRARQAFYRRDYEQSEKSYLRVIDTTKDNFDAYGELGNVYFNQGKRQEAAQAYFDAASILVRRGEKLRARSLMGLLRRLDAAKAEELQQLVQEPAGS